MDRKEIDHMKKTAMRDAVSVVLICILILFAGCTGQDSSETAEDWLLSEPEYVSEWPENEFTRQIAKPEHGEVSWVMDVPASDDFTRYGIAVTGITRAESEAYIEELNAQGYARLASEGNETSVGTMLKKEGVVLSIAYSGDGMVILISMEEAS